MRNAEFIMRGEIFMGSFKNKINNKKQKKKENAAVSELIDLKKKMKAQYAAGEYVEAMDTMAELAEHKKMDPEVMYMGASCYFMTGDYERAATWVNNTLRYDPQSIAARLLLARLCFAEGKNSDGFAILNFVVERYAGGIRDTENKILLEMLEYCSDNMAEEMSQYSALVGYFQKYYVLSVTKPQPAAPETATSQVKAETVAEDEGKTKAKAAVDRLKALLNKSKGSKADSETQKTSPVPTSAAGGDVSETPDQIIEKVMTSNISFGDKVKSLNNFAGGLYIKGDYTGALKLLQKALEIDIHDANVLKNLAYTCIAMQDKDKALEYASAMPMVDFALLRAINGHCHK